MNTFSEVFKAIASYPWQVNVGVLSLIPLYIIDFKFFCKLNIGLQRKIALAKERGHVARGMIVKRMQRGSLSIIHNPLTATGLPDTHIL